MKHILMIVLIALMMGGCGAGKSSVQTANGTVTTVGVEEFAKVISKKRRWAYRMETSRKTRRKIIRKEKRAGLATRPFHFDSYRQLGVGCFQILVLFHDVFHIGGSQTAVYLVANHGNRSQTASTHATQTSQ